LLQFLQARYESAQPREEQQEAEQEEEQEEEEQRNHQVDKLEAVRKWNIQQIVALLQRLNLMREYASTHTDPRELLVEAKQVSALKKLLLPAKEFVEHISIVTPSARVLHVVVLSAITEVLLYLEEIKRVLSLGKASPAAVVCFAKAIKAMKSELE
jgi:hypothetical protein